MIANSEWSAKWWVQLATTAFVNKAICIQCKQTPPENNSLFPAYILYSQNMPTCIWEKYINIFFLYLSTAKHMAKHICFDHVTEIIHTQMETTNKFTIAKVSKYLFWECIHFAALNKISKQMPLILKGSTNTL